MTNKTLRVFIFFLIFFLPAIISADSPSIVINEVAWMGTESSYNDEWIEFYNNTENNINLDGWVLKADDGTPEINLTGTIPAKSFYLLERTDDETLPNIKADLIYKGSLNNKGEYLKLIAKDGKIIDQIDCSSGWFTGDNKSKTTMERKNPLALGNDSQNWQTSQSPGGTPKAKNSQGEKEPEVGREAEPELKEKTVSYPSNIFINEILPSPEGPDAENEWIEIFNQNSSAVNLSDWQITDSIGKTKVYTFLQGTVIETQGFLVLNRPLTKITLNNSGDNLILLQPNGNIVDEVSYEKAPRGKSFNKINSAWFWSPILTPGAVNIIPPLVPKEEPQEKTGVGLLQAETSPDSKIKKGIATIGKQIPKSSNFLFVLLIALTVAFLSGIIILLLRKKLNPNSSHRK